LHVQVYSKQMLSVNSVYVGVQGNRCFEHCMCRCATNRCSYRCKHARKRHSQCNRAYGNVKQSHADLEATRISTKLTTEAESKRQKQELKARLSRIMDCIKRTLHSKATLMHFATSNWQQNADHLTVKERIRRRIRSIVKE